MSDNNWTLGITLGLLGSIAINTGNNLQSLGLKSLQQHQSASSKRKTHPLSSNTPVTENKQPRRHPIPWLSPTPIKTAPFDPDNNDDSDSLQSDFVFVKVRRNPIESQIWIVGTLIFVTGSLLNFASYAFAAQSMLASLESIQFVTNLIFGRYMLGARITETMLAGTLLTVTGTIMTVNFASKETLELSISDIQNLYRSTAYVVYLVLMVIALVLLHVFYGRLATMQKHAPVKHSGWMGRLEVWLAGTRDTIMPIIYSVWSALFGTQSVVQAKVLAEMLAAHTSGKENVFKSWFTYVTILIWIATVIVWLQRLNKALETFDPLFIIPLLQCSFILFAIISGGIFFQEFSSFNASQWVGFLFGIIVMFSGLVLLTPKPKQSEDEDLHRQLLDLLLAQGGSSVNLSTTRTPRSPDPSLEGSIQSSHDDLGVIDNVRSLSPRLLRENVAKLAFDVVHGNGGSTRIYSEAMLVASIGEAERVEKRKKLLTLLVLIKTNPLDENGYSDEIVNLLDELDIELPHISPRLDQDDVGYRLCKTQEKLHNTILMEIEQSHTPLGDSPPMPSQLEHQFNNNV
ncbi:hypothetical protein ACHAWC_001929 [Mediolabrus comicus]